VAASIERLIISLKFPAAQSHVYGKAVLFGQVKQNCTNLDVDERDPCSVAARKCTVYLRS
jgi:hypothetical protein